MMTIGRWKIFYSCSFNAKQLLKKILISFFLNSTIISTSLSEPNCSVVADPNRSSRLRCSLYRFFLIFLQKALCLA